MFPLTDLQIIYGNDSECDGGFQRSTQDLNEGNNGGSIWICYKYEEPSPNDEGNIAILDIVIVKDGDTSKLDMTDDWNVDQVNNVNPNGVRLNFAVKKGHYLVAQNERNQLFLVLIFLLVFTLIMVILLYRCKVKRQSKSTELSKLKTYSLSA